MTAEREEPIDPTPTEIERWRLAVRVERCELFPPIAKPSKDYILKHTVGRCANVAREEAEEIANSLKDMDLVIEDPRNKR